MDSALKVNGRKLYELAREGKEGERKARRVRILDVKIHWVRLPEVSFSVTCSSGTYIRTLCQDIGEKLGCGGCMKLLLRTRVDRFGLPDSLRLSQVEELMREGRIGEALIPVDQVFAAYPGIRMKEKAAGWFTMAIPFPSRTSKPPISFMIRSMRRRKTGCGFMIFPAVSSESTDGRKSAAEPSATGR